MHQHAHPIRILDNHQFDDGSNMFMDRNQIYARYETKKRDTHPSHVGYISLRNGYMSSTTADKQNDIALSPINHSYGSLSSPNLLHLCHVKNLCVSISAFALYYGVEDAVLFTMISRSQIIMPVQCLP